MRSKLIRVDPEFDKLIKEINQDRILKKIDLKPSSAKITKEIARDMKKSMLNRRGSAFDILIWLIVPVLFLLLLGALFYGVNIVKDFFLQIPAFSAKINITQQVEQTIVPVANSLGILKILAVCIFVILGLSIFISNFLSRGNPIYFVIYALVASGAVVASAYLSNIYESLLQNPALGSTLQGFTMANFIMANLPIWCSIFGILGAVFIFLGIRNNSQVQVIPA